jgi:glycogenin glucosyltransferase
MMVLTPSEANFDRLMAMSAERGSWDGGDQGLLNDFFGPGGEGGEWHRLSYTYNVTPSAFYQ